MPKDKLMQAAGRLRQLGRGQKLVVMGLPDISSKIAAATATAEGAAAAAGATFDGRVTRSGLKLGLPSPKKQKGSREPDMRAVLTWVLSNTVQATLSGITEAASQGMQFAATYIGPPAASVLPERLEVGDLYGGSKGQEAVPLVLAGVAKQYSAHASKHFTLATSAGPSTDGTVAAAVAATAAAAGAESALAAGSSGCSALDRMVVDEQQLQLSGSLSSMSLDDNTGNRSLSTSSSSSGSAASLPGISTKGSSEALNSNPAGTDTVVSDVLADVCAVRERFGALGAGHSVVSGGSGADEECERELEQEEEEEQEVQRQLPAATAAAETDWDWTSAFTATSPAQLRGCTVLQLSQVLQLVASTGGVGEIGWCDKVWATHNFVHSIAASGASPGLSDYLRPVGALLLFAGTGQLLLLSEREADALQGQRWGRASYRTAKPPNLLLSLPYLRLACSTDSRQGKAAGVSSAQQQQQQQAFLASEVAVTGIRIGSPARLLASQLQRVLSVDALVGVQLFGGCVMYGSDAQRVLLHGLVSGRREAAQELVGWRGKLHTLPRSDLDRACAEDTFG